MTKTESRTIRAGFYYAACGLLLLTLASCQHPVPANTAATVNGHAVLYSDLDRALAAQFPATNLNTKDDQSAQLRLDTLRALIDNEIMLQRAQKEGLLASDADVDAKFNELKSTYTQEEFKKLLEQRKLSVAELRAQIRRDLSVQKLFNKEIGSHIAISDADVAEFYKANKASFNLPENEIRLAQIVVTPTPDPGIQNLKHDKAQNEEQAKNKIQAILLRLRQGEDFGELAQNYSEDSKTAPNGGDLGFIPESSLDKANPELRAIILAMTPGQISKIIHTPEGYRIIKLISKEPAGQRELTDPRVQESIRRQLFQRKDQLLRSAFYEVARSQAKVVNYYAESVLQSRDSK